VSGYLRNLTKLLQYNDRGNDNLFGLSKKSPLKRWQKERDDLVSRAFKAQRNGNIRLYSSLTSEAEALRKKIEELADADGQ